jgi:hypothetical protein
MSYSNNHFVYNPGSQNETSGSVTKSYQSITVNNQGIKIETKPKHFFQKIKAALQDWANSEQ